MILRVFRARIKPGTVAEWTALIKEFSIPILTGVPGLLAYYPANSLDPSDHDYILIAVWKDLDSIKAWAGERWREAIIPSEKEVALIEASSLDHYVVFDSWPPITESASAGR